MENYKISYDQQKQTFLVPNPEQHLNYPTVLRLCIWKQVQTIMDQMFSLFGKELLSFKLLI